MKNFMALMLIVLILLIGCGNMSSKYKEGQIWKYNTRVGEEDSTMTILKVEKNIVHIKINNVKIKDKQGAIRNSLGHSPIDVKSLDQSVTEYVGMDNNKLDLTGYYQWKENKGGVFTITVSEIVDIVEEGLNK